jgi:uncharacterized protein (TIGR02722 family)
MKTSPLTTTTALILAAFVLPIGCSNAGKVTRVDPETPTDFNYRFNETDAQQVFHTATADALARPWIDNYLREHNGQRPIIVLRTVKNGTQDYIDTNLFTNLIQQDLLNSGRVRVKAEQDFRKDIRDERLDTQYNDPATIKAVAKELNADAVMVGRIGEVRQQSLNGHQISQYYQVNLQILNAETGEVLWSVSPQMKKVANR